jgi:hypothetical protein
MSKKGLIEVGEHAFILSPDLGPDVQAVVGAKNSRAPSLKKRWRELVESTPIPVEEWDWQDPPEPVKRFLDLNLAGYAHASIGEMAPVWVSNDGFGWPAAWLLLDMPRFIGQESSSRVIDQGDVENSREPCRYAPPETHELHHLWLEFYDSLGEDDRGAKSRAYKFDDRRFALPGTMRTGTGYYNANSRDVVRHLQHMTAFGGFAGELAEEYLAACLAYAPKAVESLTMRDGKPRPPRHNPKGQWRGLGHVDGSMLLRHAGSMCEQGVVLDFIMFNRDMLESVHVTRPGPREYLDELYHHCGQIGLTQFVSVGTARDEHRHRMCMPWRVDVVFDGDGPALCPWTPFEVPPDLWRKTGDVFNDLWENAESPVERWRALHALPFCAMLRMSSRPTLPSLLYKAELRAGAPNGHWEYKRQNAQILRHLCKMLPPHVVEREHIGGVLAQETENLL